TNDTHAQQLSFIVAENPDFIKNVEYRCILLPLSKNATGNMSKTNDNHESDIDFLFNLEIAEEQLLSDYTVANAAGEQENKKAGNGYDYKRWEVNILPSTTDNFGDLLENGRLYIPVILSFLKAGQPLASKFTNAWTGYTHGNYYKAAAK
ncbi:MAG: hypothetical protein ABUL44_00690, partial [Flavobacterium sp.]